ncbi:hypothetical protein Acr_26g0001490 [Actinidia rufa]|uniref:Uncharacterized protein n=1 Tax=Actinidia rufa TaxID=165716 RepID=A0A7J0H1A6_9ERIC|nr:hypothetical protein Acr_26g0001490 [Actinidia rufa]
MVSKSYNGGRGSWESQGEFFLIPRTPGERGTKLLADAQRAAVGLSEQRPCQFFLAGDGDYRDAPIRRMEAKMEEMRQVLDVNNLKMLGHKVDESSSELRKVGQDVAPQGRPKDTPSLADFDVDLLHDLNAKRCKEEGDLQVKLVTKAATVARSILPMRLEARIPRSVPMEQHLLRVFPLSLSDLGMKWFEKFPPI